MDTSQTPDIRALIHDLTLDDLKSTMKDKGSKDEAGFLLLGHETGSVPLITDFAYVGQGHRICIDILPEKYAEDVALRLSTMNSLEGTIYLPAVSELGDRRVIYRLISEGKMKKPKALITLPNGIVGIQSKKIVGGAHTHPGLECRLSSSDMLGIREALASAKRTPWTYSELPWIEVIHDPIRNRWGIFGSADGVNSRLVALYSGNVRAVDWMLRQLPINYN